MLTNNYYQILKAATLVGQTGLIAVDSYGVSRDLYNWDYYAYTKSYYSPPLSMAGSCFFLNYSSDAPYLSAAKLATGWSGYGPYVSFGSGTTAPTLSDYALENDVSSYLTLGAQTGERTIEGNTVTIKSIYTLINNSDTDVTIGEVGMYRDARYSRSNSGAWFLTDRSVLDTPITIPANGGIGEVTYIVTFTLPFAPQNNS